VNISSGICQQHVVATPACAAKHGTAVGSVADALRGRREYQLRHAPAARCHHTCKCKAKDGSRVSEADVLRGRSEYQQRHAPEAPAGAKQRTAQQWGHWQLH
jgi:putative hemolysin